MHSIGTTEETTLVDLNTFHRNPRRGNIDAIAQSLTTNGQYKPIVVNRGTHTGRPMEVLAGNHTLLAARKLGWEKLDTYIVDVDEDRANRIVLADNRTADLGSYDDEELAALLSDVDGLEGTGYQDEDLAALLDTNEDMTYTRDVNIPLYEPTRDTPPPIESLYDSSKTTRLEEHIVAAGLDEDTERFLLLAAQRHTRLDFQQIAEFYAHASPDVQALMEDQALIILDVDDAIRGGYATLQEDIDTQKLAERAEDDE